MLDRDKYSQPCGEVRPHRRPAPRRSRVRSGRAEPLLGADITYLRARRLLASSSSSSATDASTRIVVATSWRRPDSPACAQRACGRSARRHRRRGQPRSGVTRRRGWAARAARHADGQPRVIDGSPDGGRLPGATAQPRHVEHHRDRVFGLLASTNAKSFTGLALRGEKAAAISRSRAPRRAP